MDESASSRDPFHCAARHLYGSHIAHSPCATGTNHGLTGNSAIVAFPAVRLVPAQQLPGPVNVNPILQSLRQGVRRARLRRAAPRPQSPPTSCPNSSAATGALRNGPNDDTQYTRFVATLLTVAELGIRPCEELGWNVRRYIHLPDTAVATRHLTRANLNQRGHQACASIAKPPFCPSTPARPPSRSYTTSGSRSPMA